MGGQVNIEVRLRESLAVCTCACLQCERFIWMKKAGGDSKTKTAQNIRRKDKDSRKTNKQTTTKTPTSPLERCSAPVHAKANRRLTLLQCLLSFYCSVRRAREKAGRLRACAWVCVRRKEDAYGFPQAVTVPRRHAAVRCASAHMFHANHRCASMYIECAERDEVS